MKYRRLDENDDYVLGRGEQGFYTGIDAVAQLIATRLRLLLGTFWRDTSDGLPLFQSMLAASGSDQNQNAIADIISSRIQETQSVVLVQGVTVQMDPTTRKYTYQTNVETDYSTLTLQGTVL